MYVNAAADSVMLQLYLRHDFYNMIFKIKHKSYVVSRSSFTPHPPKEKILVAHLFDVTCMYANASSKNMKFYVKIICSLNIT
jgi:hypothetical protein